MGGEEKKSKIMKSCPSCGGIIGRDCFNPIECAQITASMNAQCNCGYEQILGELQYVRGVDMPALEQEVQEACVIIGKLLDMLNDPTMIQNGEDLSFAEHFYRKNYNEPKEVNKTSSLDDLPF